MKFSFYLVFFILYAASLLAQNQTKQRLIASSIKKTYLGSSHLYDSIHIFYPNKNVGDSLEILNTPREENVINDYYSQIVYYNIRNRHPKMRQQLMKDSSKKKLTLTQEVYDTLNKKWIDQNKTIYHYPHQLGDKDYEVLERFAMGGLKRKMIPTGKIIRRFNKNNIIVSDSSYGYNGTKMVLQSLNTYKHDASNNISESTVNYIKDRQGNIQYIQKTEYDQNGNLTYDERILTNKNKALNMHKKFIKRYDAKNRILLSKTIEYKKDHWDSSGYQKIIKDSGNAVYTQHSHSNLPFDKGGKLLTTYNEDSTVQVITRYNWRNKWLPSDVHTKTFNASGLLIEQSYNLHDTAARGSNFHRKLKYNAAGYLIEEQYRCKNFPLEYRTVSYNRKYYWETYTAK